MKILSIHAVAIVNKFCLRLIFDDNANFKIENPAIESINSRILPILICFELNL